MNKYEWYIYRNDEIIGRKSAKISKMKKNFVIHTVEKPHCLLTTH